MNLPDPPSTQTDQAPVTSAPWSWLAVTVGGFIARAVLVILAWVFGKEFAYADETMEKVNAAVAFVVPILLAGAWSVWKSWRERQKPPVLPAEPTGTNG